MLWHVDHFSFIHQCSPNITPRFGIDGFHAFEEFFHQTTVGGMFIRAELALFLVVV